jgi:hypothetical protein
MTRPRDAQDFLSSLEPLECSICFEGYDSDHPAIMLECRHIFGEKCLREHIERGASECPMCRTSLFGETEVSLGQGVQQPPTQVPTVVVRPDSFVPLNRGVKQLPIGVSPESVRARSVVPSSRGTRRLPTEVLTESIRGSVVPSSRGTRLLPAEVLTESTRVGSVVPPSRGTRRIPAQVLTESTRLGSVVPSSRGTRRLPNGLIADSMREDNIVRWIQEIQLPSGQVPTNIIRVLSHQSAWSRLVDQRMKWLVSKSNRFVAALRKLPGQAAVKLGLRRRNGGDEHPTTSRSRNRLQRNPERHSQGRLTDRQDQHRSCGQVLRDWGAEFGARSNPTTSRARRRHQEHQDRAYAEHVQRGYYERDNAYEVSGSSYISSRSTNAGRDREYGTHGSTSDGYRSTQFRNAGLNSLYISSYDSY